MTAHYREETKLINTLLDLFLHLDKNMGAVIQSYGMWTYLILFLIVFAETGFVITPFLPGDSLLFVAGAFAASGSLSLQVVVIILGAAAIIGDTLNYQIGHFVGPSVFKKDNARFLNQEHLKQTEQFYLKHGGKTIIIARFIPVIRTFAPFVAGIGAMSYWRFLAYNLIGGLGWVITVVFGGYFFGNLPIVRNNFTLVIFAIIFISILPGIIGFARRNDKA
ncbi:DedA family protein [Desulfosporosinus metallidurans]|uniref:DedA family protein n=1 Tax=Desulfosporosinus metallidurans TaxID=1888891 RepID=UPI00094D5431|nr:DedA family protein [Desulfosporosinus metallidurans]